MLAGQKRRSNDFGNNHAAHCRANALLQILCHACQANLQVNVVKDGKVFW